MNSALRPAFLFRLNVNVSEVNGRFFERSTRILRRAYRPPKPIVPMPQQRREDGFGNYGCKTCEDWCLHPHNYPTILCRTETPDIRVSPPSGSSIVVYVLPSKQKSHGTNPASAD